MESFASTASFAQVILYVPPVIFRSSLPEIPLPCVEDMVKVPSPFKTISSFEKMTASVLVSPSAVNAPVTERLLVPLDVVTKHLSDDTTYIAGVLSFVMLTLSSTSCTFALLFAFTFIVQFLALPLIT